MGYLAYDLTTKVVAWTIAIIYIGIIAVIFFIRMIKAPKEPKSQKAMFRSTGLFFVCYIIIRVFFLFSDFERDANGVTDFSIYGPLGDEPNNAPTQTGEAPVNESTGHCIPTSLYVICNDTDTGDTLTATWRSNKDHQSNSWTN